jgi:hypothetical protein
MAQLSTGGGRQNFAIYYVVKDRAFLRAAQTWKSALGGESCDLVAVAYLYELISAFKQLSQLAKDRGAVFSRGALFVHSSPPNQDETSLQRGVHFRQFKAKTLAELRYKEEVLTPSGLTVDTASVALLKKLEPLPWAPDGRLQIFGCFSGYSEPGRASLAEILMKTQGVPTRRTRRFMRQSRTRTRPST